MKNKHTQYLINVLIVVGIILALSAMYRNFSEARLAREELRQVEYDYRYKETVNSSSEYPYQYVYRRYDRYTGDVQVVINIYDVNSEQWITREPKIDQ